MPAMPTQPKIYHITHVDNLPGIIADGWLVSDALRISTAKSNTNIGMASIKATRLAKSVPCHPGTFVGDYVPFYFCPRSVMLYVLHMGNNPGLTYTGGQGAIVHLEADVGEVIKAATKSRWAFTLGNASARYAIFHADKADLKLINWPAVAADDWRDALVQNGKQAEFLVHNRFPWRLVARIGVNSAAIKAKVEAALQSAKKQPPVTVEPTWYY
jgi:ssDNA thymidine ADP-ribosyltransferase, DarT